MRNNKIWEPWSTARVMILLAVLLAGAAVLTSGGYVTAAQGPRDGRIAPSPVPTEETPLASPTGTPEPVDTGTPQAGATQTLTSTDTPEATFTVPPTETPVPTSTNTNTPEAEATSTNTPEAGATSTSIVTDTPTPHVPTAVPTAVPTVAPTVCTISFTDVLPTDWFYDYVQWMACHGFASGYSDGTFQPGNIATRAQIAKIVVLATGWAPQEPQSPTFEDVPPGSAFYGYVEAAAAHGIISGYDDRTFRPGNNVTRGQLCKVIVLARGWPLYTPRIPTFADVAPSSAFFGYVETAVQQAIVSGYSDNTFKPGNLATRAQLSKIVQAAFASAQ